MSIDQISAMQERMYRNILNEINKCVDEAREQIIKDAVTEFEKRIRAAAGSVAIQVSDYFTIERSLMGKDMIITVRVLNEARNESRT